MSKQLDEALSEGKEPTVNIKDLVQVKLTPAQTQQWDMTRTSLMWNCPAFTHILYTMMSDHGAAIFTEAVPTAATDGTNLIFNPKFFFGKSLQERVFIMAHEISHAIFNHCGMMHMMRRRQKVITKSGKALPYDHQIMNIAMDLVINDMLVEAGVGKFVQGGLHDKQYGTQGDSVIDVYEKVFKDAKKISGQGFDIHLTPGAVDGKDPDKAMGDRSEIEWNTELAAAAASAKAQGKLPASLERFFKDFIEPEVSWQDKIQSFFARKVGSGSYDWRKPDRNWIVRDVYVPGRSGFGAGHVVVAIDTSGSIGQPELDRFFAEMRGILNDVRPKKMSVVWCDAKVHKVDEIDDADDVRGLKPAGGGGTDFRPVFDWIEKNGSDVDCLVYLTDGYGSFPSHEPKYPVLWGAIIKGVNYPWGDVVDVPIKS